MSARKKTPEADPRERILAAAAEAFATLGYEAARVDDIAARAGINKAMLYYHVGDKQSLYATVLTSTIERVLAAMQAAIAPLHSPSERVQAILETLTRMATETPLFIPVVLREVASGGAHLPDEMILRMSSVFRLVAGVLAEGTESGAFQATDPLLTHASIIGATLFLVASAPVRRRVAKISGVPASEHTPAQLAAHVGNLFLHGLETDRPAPKPRRRS